MSADANTLAASAKRIVEIASDYHSDLGNVVHQERVLHGQSTFQMPIEPQSSMKQPIFSVKRMYQSNE